MNKPVLATTIIALALLAASCGGSDTTEVAAGQPTPEGTAVVSESDSESDVNASARIERLWIGPQLVDCVGSGPQKCMLVRRSADGDVEYFYDGIQGFTHEVGTTYVIDVEVTDIANPPADASSLSYQLVEIVETSTETASDVLDGSSWSLIGFRDGDLFDQVPEDVSITIAFEGEQVSGSAGCNNYMGTAELAGNALSFGPVGATKMFCSPEVMAFEDRYLLLLSDVETAEVTFDGRLVLSPPTGMTLVFERL